MSLMWHCLKISYQIDPSIKVSGLSNSLPLALILQTDLQVPVSPGDEGAGVLASHHLVQAEVVLGADVHNPLLEQVHCGRQRTA